MAKEEKKLQSFNSFNAGEYSPQLAGRIDLQSFGSSARRLSNFMLETTGGIKKFYGTKFVARIQQQFAGQKVRLVPFINTYEPMAFVLIEPSFNDVIPFVKIGLVYGDKYEDLDLVLPANIDITEIRWKQINDVVIFVHSLMQPKSINFLGVGADGKYSFSLSDILFTEVPFFPIGSTRDYIGEVVASGISGTVTVSIASTPISVGFPVDILGSPEYTRFYKHESASVEHTSYYIDQSTVSVFMVRGGEETAIVSNVKCNSSSIWKHGDNKKIELKDVISQEKVLQAIKTVYPKSYIRGTNIELVGVSGVQDDDEFYMEISVGQAYKIYINDRDIIWAANTYTSDSMSVSGVAEFDTQNVVGRKIKFYFNGDEEVSPWWQSKQVSNGDYAFSNNHWYKALNDGTCGNIQPSHTVGSRSDGGVVWKYVHSGSCSASVIEAKSKTELVIQIPEGKELPVNSGNVYENYAWSIWGVNGRHPSDVYMAGNRLCFICNTDGYGAWNTMSVVDDYYNMSTEEYGQQLDTSAIVQVIPNNESGAINWVLSRKVVYMGSYSGEYTVSGMQGGVYTPTRTAIENISNIGGRPVIPLKYKDLSMFVETSGKELYSLGYNYASDDYDSSSVSIMSQHLLERGIERIEALNNRDKNVYIRTADNGVVLLTYDKAQKVLGMSQLDIGHVVDVVCTSAKDISVCYMAVEREPGYLYIESASADDKTYMLSSLDVKSTKTKFGVDLQEVSGVVAGNSYYSSANVIQVFHNQDDESVSESVWYVKSGELEQLESYSSNASIKEDGSIVSRRIIKAYDDGVVFAKSRPIVSNPMIPDLSFEYLEVSKDFGATWTTTEVLYSGVPYTGTLARLGDTIYLDGTEFYKSSDGGTSWSEAESAEGSVYSIADFDNSLFKLCHSETGSVIYMSLDGELWEQISNEKNVNLGTRIQAISKVGGLYSISTDQGIVVFSGEKIVEFHKNPQSATVGALPGILSQRKLITNSSSDLFVVNENEVHDDIAFADLQVVVDSEYADYLTETIGIGSYKVLSDGSSVLLVNETTGRAAIAKDAENQLLPTDTVVAPHLAGKDVYVCYDNTGSFVKKTVNGNGVIDRLPESYKHTIGLPMVCELHTQPAFGNKVEGMQQQSIAVYLRLHKSGAFYYGASVDFDKYFEYSDWPDRQEFGEGRALYTGDCALNIPLGYAEAANQGDAKYPNSSAVGINIKCDTPEPFNLLAIQEIYK